MKRLVYRPKVWAYVKTDSQAIDISPYLVSGTVNRIVNDISTASLTLRNPDFKFTTPGSPTFHPMDPITIYMARTADHPVRVFTGFLDTTPYLQLFPGTITLDASCTMKRLKYTYWDPALPFSKAFLGKYGWEPATDGSTAYANLQGVKTIPVSKIRANGLTDGGFQNILFGILEAVGNWQEEDIFIESLPTGIVDTVTKVFGSFKKEDQETEAALKAYLSKMIGETAATQSSSVTSNGAGTNGGADSTAPPSGTGWKKIVATVFGNGGLPAKYGTAPTTFHDADSDKATANGMGYRGPITPWSYGEIGNSQLGGKPPGYKYLLYANGKQVVVEKRDINGYNPGDGRVMDIWIHTASYLYPNARTYSDFYKLPNSVTHGMEVYIKEIDQKTPVGPYQGISGPTPTPKVSTKTPSRGHNPDGPHQPRAKVASISNLVGADIVNAATTVIEASIPAPRSSRKVVAASTTPLGGGTNFPGTLPSQKPKSGLGPTLPGALPATKPKDSDFVFPLAKSKAGVPSTWTTDQGVDITAPGNTPLVAVSNGTIVTRGIQGFGPSAPVLKLNSGGYVYYGHAGPGQARAVGSKVNAGEVISEVGAGIVGISTGPHLEIGFCDAAGTPIGNQASRMKNLLAQSYTNAAVNIASVAGDSGSATTTVSGGAAISPEAAQGVATASAFATIIELPSALETTEAIALTGQKSYLNDKPLIDFINALCVGSMRHYQSLPDGRFYAFFPDFFGTFNPGRPPYWEIDDIEVTDGHISLSDENLKTHVYVVGDTFVPGTQSIGPYEDINSDGVVTIFNAFGTNWLLSQSGGKSGGMPLFKDAAGFLNRYGVRPDYHPEPLIRSHFFEAFSAFQRFMFAWSRQFLTQFQFTFMPELYPGGRVAFKDHDLVCYVDSVTHQFDYTSGFETIANLSSPSALNTNNDGEMEKFTYGMVKSF